MSTAAEVYMCISGEGEGDDDDDGEDKYDYDYGGMELELDDEKAKVNREGRKATLVSARISPRRAAGYRTAM